MSCAGRAFASTAVARRLSFGKLSRQDSRAASSAAGPLGWPFFISYMKRRPFATNVILSFSAAWAGDYAAQRAEGATELDLRRSLLLSSMGLWMGVCNWHVYINVFARLFPRALTFANQGWAAKLADSAGQRDLVKQVVVDLAVYMPFFYFPMFYAFKVVLQGGALDAGHSLWNLPAAALGRYRETFFEDNAACCAVWVPGDIFCFVVPMWLRMPAGFIVNFIWNGLLSNLRGHGQLSDEPS